MDLADRVEKEVISALHGFDGTTKYRPAMSESFRCPLALLVDIRIRLKRGFVGREVQEHQERATVADCIHARDTARFGIDNGFM